MNNLLNKGRIFPMPLCNYLCRFNLYLKTKLNLLILLLFTFVYSLNSFSQSINTNKIDSLESLLLKKNNDFITKAKIYGYLAEEYQELEPDKSLYLAQKLFSISKKIQYKKGIVDYYKIAASNHLALGDYDKALKFGEKASKEYLQIKDSLNYLKNIINVVRSYYRKGYMDKGIEIALEIVNNSNKINYNYEIGELCYHLCVMFNNKNNIDKALFYIENAEKYYFQSENKFNGILKCYQQRSQIYTKTNHHQRAIFYAEKALKIATQIDSHETVLSNLYTTLGIAQFNFGNNIKAIECFNKVAYLNKFSEIEDRKKFNLVMLSQAYLRLKKYNKALSFAKEALTGISDTETSLIAYRVIGKSYYQLQNYNEALKNQLISLNLLKEVNKANHQRLIYLDISKTYKKLQFYELAYKFLNKYQESEIKFLKELEEKNISDLEIKYDLKQKDLELKKLTISRQNQILEEKNFISRLSILFVFILVTLLILLNTIFKNKKKNNLLKYKNKIISDKIMIVEEQKVKLSQSLLERELLLKEIHHRVKNNLQIVISLLSIQAKEGDKTNIDDFLEKGQTRINSMALIHQSLYENENLDNINFNDYLLKLIDDLKNLLNITNTDLSYKIDAKDMFFDIQTAIPLGLIVNELFSNAYKYAFKNVEKGEIKIAIKKIDDDYYELEFSDNGNGYSEENSNKKSLGLELVSLLVKQLKGKITKEKCKGTSYKIIFKEIIN